MRRKFDGSTALKDAPTGREPAPILNVLTSALKTYGLDKEIARYDFVLHWKDIVGAEIFKRTKPECIRGKALVVRVSNSTWAQELSFHKDFILGRLKKYLKSDEIVDDVHFYVGPL